MDFKKAKTSVIPRADEKILNDGDLEVSRVGSQVTSVMSDEENHYLKCRHNLCHRTVVVHNVLPTVTKSELMNHFGKFGNVRQLKQMRCVNECEEEREKKVVTVEYNDNLTALRVLKSPKRQHLYLGRFFIPNSCCIEKWKCYKRIKFGKKDENEPDLQCHFHKLANETIYQILSFLPFRERFRASGVCTRWRQANKRWTEVQVINFRDQFGYSSSRTLTRDILNSFLEKCGRVLDKINFDSCRQKLPRGFPIEIAECCPHLQHINLSKTSVKPTAIKTLVQKCNQLEIVELSACNGIDDRCVKWLAAGQNLKYLDLSKSFNVTGKTFDALNGTLETLILHGCKRLTPEGFLHLKNSGIKDLRLKNCPSLTTDSVVAVIKALQPTLIRLDWVGYFKKCRGVTFLKFITYCQNLTYLNLEENVHIFSDMVRLIPLKCPQLSHLNLSANSWPDDALRYLRTMSQLRNLYLNYNKMLTDDALLDISESGNFEHVEMRGCSLIGNLGCVALFRDCPRLKFLDISNCAHVTNELIFEICVLDREDNDKIEIIAGGTGITQFINNRRLKVSSSNLCPVHYRRSSSIVDAYGVGYL